MSKDRKTFSEDLDTVFKELKKELLYFHNKDNDYGESMMEWFKESAIKNRVIHSFKNNPKKHDKEMARRRRSNVYYIDLGVNVGSEFNYNHFCVVIAEHTYTAVVIPLSSKKEKDAGGWKEDERSAYLEIGKITGFPEETKEEIKEEVKDCYALIGQIKTISKQRLSDYLDRQAGKYVSLSLSDGQMDLIDAAIIKHLTNNGK